MPDDRDWPLTVGRQALLSDGSDRKFRRLLHGLMSYGRIINDIRSHFGDLLGISGVQYEILMAVQRLEGEEGVSVSDVANWIRRSPVFVTNEVKALVKHRLVEKRKSNSDGRKVLLRLTNIAEKQVADLAPSQRNVNDILFEDMSAEEFETLVDVITRLLPCGDRALGTLGAQLHNNKISPN